MLKASSIRATVHQRAIRGFPRLSPRAENCAPWNIDELETDKRHLAAASAISPAVKWTPASLRTAIVKDGKMHAGRRWRRLRQQQNSTANASTRRAFRAAEKGRQRARAGQ
jgi:hypothetical protein